MQSPLQFVGVLDGLFKSDCEEGLSWEQLYVDDLISMIWRKS